MFVEKHSLYKAFCFWMAGDSRNFFRIINGSRPFSPAPWDKTLWLEYLSTWYDREELIDILNRGAS